MRKGGGEEKGRGRRRRGRKKQGDHSVSSTHAKKIAPF